MKRTIVIVGVTALASAVFAQSPRMTPRGSDLRMYPAPAVTPIPAGQALGPYSTGLAAAAPVGTPYLRSPAFAGPPIIYMPQTVTRVLVPAVTPYPGNVMQATNYVYASAPFLRTDIYTSLPYGTYFWPQGFAGAQPVAPTLPVYVEAPATAILSTEASYAAQRYAPGVAGAEVVSPITCVVTPTPEPPQALPPSEMVIVPKGQLVTPAPAEAKEATPTPAEKSPFSPEVQVPILTPAPAAPTPAPAPTPAATPAPTPAAPAPSSLPPLAPIAPPANNPNT
ncbi:MAG: hypothetical protein ACP5QZ_00975 [Candidatus Sumerlaeaceae bacterium]